MRRRMDRSRIRAFAFLLAVVAAVCVAVPAGGQQSEGGLRDKIDSQRRSGAVALGLGGAAGQARARDRARGGDPGGRRRRVQAELDAAETRARRHRGAPQPPAQARAAPARAAGRVARAARRELLRQRYMGGKPDLVTVVLAPTASPTCSSASTSSSASRRRTSGSSTSSRTPAATRAASAGCSRALDRRSAGVAADAVRPRATRWRRSPPPPHERRDALAQARAARLAALRATRASRRRAERTLNAPAGRSAPAPQAAGPGGPWSIPWPIVQCESGGQNLPPNSAGASGYYQILPSTWRGLGGSTPPPTRRPRPSRTGSRRSCGPAARARATGSAPRSSASSEIQRRRGAPGSAILLT